jgi:hypothetical protein
MPLMTRRSSIRSLLRTGWQVRRDLRELLVGWPEMIHKRILQEP